MTSQKNKPLFISFEGSEGSGKTTQIALLQDRFEKMGREVLVTREPGGTEIGEEIRHLLKYCPPEGSKMFPETELLLFAASRAQLVRERIFPSLEAGKVVLCDRYLDSTTVYQGVARKISSDPVAMINRFAVGNVMPDLTIILDIPAELGFKRIETRSSDLPDRMEQESIDFYRAVRDGYLLLARSLPSRFVVVDGTQSKETVAQFIWDEIGRRKL